LPIGFPSVTTSGAAVAGLDLVGDPQAAGCAGEPDQLLDVGRIEVGDAVAHHQRVEDRRRGREPALGQAFDRHRETGGVEVTAPVRVRGRERLDVRRSDAVQPAFR
jgi:hypothetical protein